LWSLSKLLPASISQWLSSPPDHDWILESEWVRIQQTPVKAKKLLYGVVITIFVLILWSYFAVIDEVSRGEGKVVPFQKLQILQSYDGGIIEDILVQEGQLVNAGQILLRVDPTRFLSSLEENNSQYFAFEAKVQRLKALTGNRKLTFSDELIKKASEITKNEKKTFDSNLLELNELEKGYDNRISQRKEELISFQVDLSQYIKSLALTQKELDLTTPLLSSGAVSEIDLLRLQRQVVELTGNVQRTESAILKGRSALEEEKNNKQEAILRTINLWNKELNEGLSKMASLKESQGGLKDVVTQSEIRAPVKGTIQRLFFNTKGGVISPGSQVAEIIPYDDQLIVEAKVSPKDIAFIKQGQSAILKFSAYDFSTYGGMQAIVDHISADTITDEKDNTFYIVRLHTMTKVGQQPLEILPGMTVQVDIITGKRTILGFILKPLLKAASSSLKER